MVKGSERSAGTDHRRRVARARRQRTEARILESALRVFAEKGPDAPVIDDFVRAAGIARGTFYNYYRSTAELLEAVAHVLEDDLIRSIEMELEALQHPLERLATGVLLWLGKAQSDPVWCSFVVRARRRAQGVERELGRDLRDGIAAGVLDVSSAAAARDLVVGTILEAMTRMTVERVPRTYCVEIARAILRGLGVERRRAAAVLARPWPAIRRPTKSLAPQA
jgi:AcrR family transcriptional regulator